MLMRIILRAAEATLELSLARLAKERLVTEQWLRRLGAARVAFDEPHFPELAAKGPEAMYRATATRAVGRKSEPEAQPREVQLVSMGMWEIGEQSTEATLILLDRLRFEAAREPAEAEAAEEPPAWASPEEQIRGMLEQMAAPPEDEQAPQFLFIARAPEEALEQAGAEAFAAARQDAQRLARAAGQRLGRLTSINFQMHTPSRTDRLMERQRCSALLADGPYELSEDEVISDSPRAAEFTIGINVHYDLE
jgi:hypothetical protein